MNTEKNSFDLLRYYATISVMLLHFTSYYQILGGVYSPATNILRRISLFFPGVLILFSISGFLMCRSLDRRGSSLLFLWDKGKRILPTYWIATGCNVIVILLLAGNRLDKSFVVWIATQVIGLANTPSCLKDFATGSVNGALWTIGVQLQMYVAGAFFWRYLKKWSVKGWSLLLLCTVCCNLLCDYVCNVLFTPEVMIARLIERTILPYMMWYVIGMLCYRFRDQGMVWIKRISFLSLPVYLVYYVLAVYCPGYYADVITGMVCPFAAIGLAYSLPAGRIRMDITYELFLVHWIVLNVMIHFRLLQTLTMPMALCIFVCGSLLAAIAVRIAKTFFQNGHIKQNNGCNGE